MSGTTTAVAQKLHPVVLTAHKVTLTALAPAKHAVTNAWADQPGHPHMTPNEGAVLAGVILLLIVIGVIFAISTAISTAIDSRR
jgi:hypothetical protein